MTRKSRSTSAAPTSATAKAPAPTARERYAREALTNPKWKEAPKTGETVMIVGALAVKK